MPECTATGLSVLATLAALSTGVCAGVSLWLAIRIHREAKSDERIIFGPLDHPYGRVTHPDHHNAVVGCAVFNKARRKAFINNVVAFDERDETVDIAWAESIDHLGNPGEPRALIGIVDSNNLYIRRNDGESIHYLQLEITHSFRDSPETVVFDPTSNGE